MKTQFRRLTGLYSKVEAIIFALLTPKLVETQNALYKCENPNSPLPVLWMGGHCQMRGGDRPSWGKAPHRWCLIKSTTISESKVEPGKEEKMEVKVIRGAKG